MENKEVKNENFKERFEFVLYMNDNVICQRYFKINSFDERSVYSPELAEAVEYIVKLIEDNMKSKSRVFTWYTNHPQLDYPGDLEFGKGRWTQTPREADDVPPVHPAWTVTFKFAFKVDGREVISRIWDGSSYPRMVAENVDLANKKMKMEDFDFTRAKLDMLIQRAMTNDKKSLIPLIIDALCEATSRKGQSGRQYTVRYGNTTYNLAPVLDKMDIEAMLGDNPFFKGGRKGR